MINLLLIILATVLSLALSPIGLMYSIIKRRFKVKKYFKSIAKSIDQLGGVVMQDVFNDLLIKDSNHNFGDEDETISSVIGKNKVDGTLTNLGVWLDAILERIDPNHSINAIEYERSKI
jgi:hypothetical protein